MSENLLRHETSPYLLQHRDNPVHWRPWGPDALAEAAASDKPILLSVGYAACHWCHVMAHESFEDETVAAVMNRLFVNIKVDREERPDIDQIYMKALQALGDQGGWPLTMFLTPAGAPFWGGTYFPKTPLYGRPGFVAVLEAVSDLWQRERGKVTGQAGRLLDHLRRPEPSPEAMPALGPDLLDRAADSLLSLMDRERGGTRGAPKFPNASVLGFLDRTAGRTGRRDLAQLVDTTLTSLCEGGIYDHIGGGLARYSVDAEWLVPHFEKMLYDNGQLLTRLAAHAHRSGLFRIRIDQVAGWMAREMRLEGGAFAASLDADSEGEEGRFYIWTPDALAAALPPADAELVGRAYDIRPGGNWEGVSVPNRLRGDRLTDDEQDRLPALLATLRAERETRPRPGRDDKILADWNGLAITGLADSGFRLDRPDLIEAAETAYRFVATTMARGDRLGHAWKDGRLVFPGFAGDLAGMASAALALHRATGGAAYIEDAIRWLDALERHHGDGAGGFHFTADDAEELVLRPVERLDEATPNPHGLAASAHVRLWHLSGDDRWRARADRLLEAARPVMVGNVFGTASLLSALDLRLFGTLVLIVSSEGQEAEALLGTVRAARNPNLILDRRADGEMLPPAHPAHGKKAVGGKPTAHLCREGRCSLPVTEAAALAAALDAPDQVFI
ncbi:thioredoxin domain-containing protein [Prosthecomicrobium pneumaticum]|uniref:Spermatogenesis-associated protein 20-like TRX domain-containing protein n=1 Tax=Prosthecomicrobium pneumaticum TaxID=81895 RepID=A0A7W9FNX5_9HYPH|nr:thioredoxin domain-containing protein [Prosthecomicrobium pneumaticum]MBB5754110.1 hypothetical protein [Prosthecomicrobium pneumaticum]